MCVPVLYKPISHFQQGVIRSTADVRPYLRAGRMALGGSVKRRKISTCGIQRRERTRSRYSWQPKTGSDSGDSAIEKASMLLRLCASPANAQFLCVVDQSGAVTARCRACHSPRIYRVYQKAQRKTTIRWQCSPYSQISSSAARLTHRRLQRSILCYYCVHNPELHTNRFSNHTEAISGRLIRVGLDHTRQNQRAVQCRDSFLR